MNREKALRAAKLSWAASGLLDQALEKVDKALELIDELRNEDGNGLVVEAIDSVMDSDDQSPEPHVERARMLSDALEALAESLDDALASDPGADE